MLRSLPWIILGGIALIAAVIVAQLFGTYFYLRSPQRAVAGAFGKLISAKSFSFEIQAEQAAKDGFSMNASGAVDKQALTALVGRSNFSFQSGAKSFYGNGEARAKDGQLYLRFDQVAGIPDMLPGALQSIWAGVDLGSLIAVGKDQVFPEAAGSSLTEDDLQAMAKMVVKNLPVAAVGAGDSVKLDSEDAFHYRIQLDRAAAIDMASEIQSAVKGRALNPDERIALNRTVAALPPASGEIWVAKADGRLRAAIIVVGSGDQAFHVSLKLNGYDKPVSAEEPVGSRPLIDLVRRLMGTSLAGVKPHLPFEIPAPILNIEMKMPVVDTSGRGGSTENYGGLPNLFRLFYGTDKPFEDIQKKK